MGVSNSKLEEDKALQLCRERKKFVRQALDGRCSLAATHVTYIQSLKITGTALRRFVEPQVPIESSLYTSTSATPEPLALTEKSLSQFSFSSPALSQHVDTIGNLSPSPSPPTSSRYHANHMKFRGSFSRKVEEKPSMPATGSLTSSSTPKTSTPKNTTPRSLDRLETSSFDTSPIPPVSTPWDFFEPSHPIDNHFEGRELNQRLESADSIGQLREDEGVEDEKERLSSPPREEFEESEDEFDDPSIDTLVRRFENVNRATDHIAPSASPLSVASETECLNGEKRNSPDLSPLRPTASGVGLANDEKTIPVKEDGHENKVPPKDFVSSMKEIEYLFGRAAESGIEVPRMLEANKFHFRPIFPGKERGGSMISAFLKICFSCGEDPSQVQEEPAQTTVKYLTWHRTTSSRSSSSRNPLGADTKDDIDDYNFCMVAGSHASTLDRLYAWERKLYDEVKASEMLRKAYDQKCRLLRQLESKGEGLRQPESKGEGSYRVDKLRAVVKDLHSRIRVAIQRIDSISKKIEDLRDQELQPQLEELIEGLRRMWEVMFECHKQQFHIISAAYNNSSSKISLHSDAHRQITLHLEHELTSLSSSFSKWVTAQKTYVQAINGWLIKCVRQQKTSKRNRRAPPISLKDYGPPIYATCGVWLEMLNELPAKEVSDSMKGLAAEISHLLPHQEKNQGKGLNHHHHSNSDLGVNLLKEEVSQDWIMGFHRFQTSLVGFLSNLNNFAASSVKMFTDLQKSIQDAKNKHAQMKSQS